MNHRIKLLFESPGGNDTIEYLYDRSSRKPVLLNDGEILLRRVHHKLFAQCDQQQSPRIDDVDLAASRPVTKSLSE